MIFGIPIAIGIALGIAVHSIVGLLSTMGLLYFIPLGLAKFLDLRKFRSQPPDALERIVPLPLPRDTFPVLVAIRYESALTGTDQASAAFVDGWLHVEGAQSSFSLRCGDGRGQWRNGHLRIDFRDGQSVALQAVHRLAFGPQGHSFRAATEQWLAQAERPEGESILPPIVTHRTMRKGWTALTLLGILVWISAVFMSKLVGAGGFAQAVWLSLAVTGGLTSLRGAFVRAHQGEADRHARRLESSKPPRL